MTKETASVIIPMKTARTHNIEHPLAEAMETETEEKEKGKTKTIVFLE
jgi:hypothetical protein